MATTAASSLSTTRRSAGPESSLRPLSMQKQMSFDGWSRYEPIATTHTDHWSKLRSKSYKLKKLPSGNLVALCDNKDWLQAQNGGQFRAASAHSQGSGCTLAPVGSSALHQYLTERLYNPVTRRAPADSRGHGERGRVPSASSQRAKRGYKYWVDDKKPSIRKNTSLGSKGTFLGIGLPRL